MKPHLWFIPGIAWACAEPVPGSDRALFTRINLGSTPEIAYHTYVNFGWKACSTKQ